MAIQKDHSSKASEAGANSGDLSNKTIDSVLNVMQSTVKRSELDPELVGGLLIESPLGTSEITVSQGWVDDNVNTTFAFFNQEDPAIVVHAGSNLQNYEVVTTEAMFPIIDGANTYIVGAMYAKGFEPIESQCIASQVAFQNEIAPPVTPDVYGAVLEIHASAATQSKSLARRDVVLAESPDDLVTQADTPLTLAA